MGEMRRWRKMTWVLIAWWVLMIIWALSIEGTKSCKPINPQFPSIGRECSSLNVGKWLAISFVGFVVLAVIWFARRPQPAPPAASPPPPAES